MSINKFAQMKRFAIILLLSMGVSGNLAGMAKAENAASAPEELTSAIAAIEEAANNQDIEGVVENYSKNFTNTDGLTTKSLSQALQKIWESYPNLEYTTTVDSWSEEGTQLVAVTTTKIRGNRQESVRSLRLNSTIKSRQYFQDAKLIRQEILSEQSQIKSGENPPTVAIVAPKTVKAGDRYSFDLIVDEPLEDKVLLGAVQEDKTSSNLYLNPNVLELEPLPAGGIYKTVTAPLLPDSNWLSAVLVRGDGITMITHRVNVQEKLAIPKLK